MGKQSEIAWTDHTWNPWQGCRKVSAGCKNCYMFRDKKRWRQDPENIHRSGNVTFFAPFLWKKPAKVFTCSWSDFFLPEADPWRDDAWQVIRTTPHLTYQILTKRPENIKDRLPDDWPLPNVWLGVTAENQEMADKRIPLLLQIEAEKRFISIEPMLGPVNLTQYIRLTDENSLYDFYEKNGWGYDDWSGGFVGPGVVDSCYDPGPGIHWVICGGESGPGFREMKKEWAWDLIQQTEIPEVPFFMKQMAGFRPKDIPLPAVLKVKEFPKCQH